MQAIQALNPYNSSWRIKASVQNKGQLRSFTRNGSACSVFSVELVDDQVLFVVPCSILSESVLGLADTSEFGQTMLFRCKLCRQAELCPGNAGTCTYRLRPGDMCCCDFGWFCLTLQAYVADFGMC